MTRVSAESAARDVAETILTFGSTRELVAWFDTNHASVPAIWLKIAKKGAPEATVSYAEAVDAALCFGWVDGRKERLDKHYWLQRFTPRTARSRWSKINREKAERLIADGRMREPGLRAIEQARTDGRWDDAYAGSRTATVPDDLRRELDRHPDAAAAFDALDARNRYSILWRLGDAKRADTRARRVAKFVDMLRRGERLHP